jgi:hypothetical protein
MIGPHIFLPQNRQTHGPNIYKDTKPEMSSLLVTGLEIQSVMLVLSTGFVNYCRSNLLSG